ncbi:MAG: CotH kinase family protein [Bacteroidaceae bacterium]|nr:CotH kinase family protein [Bacteroidaceae bacterium]
MTQRNLFILMMLLFPLMGRGQEWLDVTSYYLSNPNFDNSTSGWQWQSNAQSQKVDYGTMEFWNGTFDISQTLTPPNGTYRLSVQAYYRVGDNNESYSSYISGSETITGYLYANEKEKPLASIYSESLSENYASSCWGASRGVYYPNQMVSGSYCFGLGMYHNELEVEVTNRTLTIGLRCEEAISSNWCLFDNFKLEFKGDRVNISSITLSEKSLSLVKGEKYTLVAHYLPEDATFPKLTWSSSDETILTVDENGNIHALKEGQAQITVSSTDGSRVSTTCNVNVINNEATSASLIINEIQAANIDMFVDPSYNYGGWIELYNPTDQTVSLTDFYVSDDRTNLKKHPLGGFGGVVNAHSYKLIWFDHYTDIAQMQITFKLDYEGGEIFISNPKGEIVCSQSYPAAITRTSYARKTDGASSWGITAEPTPGKSNNGVRFCDTRLDAPIIDKDACLFVSPFTVQVTIPAGTTLRYTTDGTTPTEENGNISSTGRFNVNTTTIYRFRLFQEGYLPSRVVTRSYIYQDREYVLPVVSVVTDPVNLYDDSLGIYVKGVNGRTGNGQNTPCNWNMEWDRPVNFELITTEGEMVINQEANMEMCGGWSRAWTPHSFKIKANKIYEGENYLPYQIFPEKSYLKHKTFQIRNGGNDTSSRIKDAALQAIVHTSGLDVEGQACQPVVHFINGEYKGMLNIREPNNKHYAEANFGLDDDEIDQFEINPDSGYTQKCGTEESFLHWYGLSENAESPDVYEEICSMVDIDEYINYMAVEMYLGGTDWPQNNVKGFKPIHEGGKFRFVLFDLDGAFSTTDPFNIFESKQIYTFDLVYETNSRLTEEIKWVTIFLNMLENKTFRKQFIDTYCLVAGSVFTPERSIAIIDSMATRTESTLQYEGCSPWWTANSLKNSLSGRQQTMINALKTYNRMNLSAVAEQKVSLSANIPEARLSINGLEVPTGKFEGSLFAPIVFKAEAPAGYRFIGWTNGKGSAQEIISKGSHWNYYDQGSCDATDWISTDASISGWGSGKAPLGYYTGSSNNERGYETILNYGSNESSKYPTYYFRKSFNLSQAPIEGDEYVLSFVVDDGFVVYVNGQEAARYLMPSGTISFNTYSSTYASGNPDNGTITLPASLFQKGKNVIAIEVHNNSASSSDIYFDAELLLYSTSPGNYATYLSQDEEFEMPSDASLSLMACYEKLSDEELAEVHAVPVRINEISADNSMYVNPTYFKKNDWIELYNTTNDAIDIAGMYLSDDVAEPEKYQIPVSKTINTVIPAHGFLIVWADKLDDVAALHTPFKLDADGGAVMLTSADKVWSDTLFYDAHSDDMTVGLYPDGGENVYLMNTPTIASSNKISSYAELWIESELPSHVETEVPLNGGSLRVTVSQKQLTVIGATSESIVVELYAATGQQVLKRIISLTNGTATVGLEALPKGIYLVRVSEKNGSTYSGKILMD